MNVTPETTIATLIKSYQRDRTKTPEPWPHVDGNAAQLSTHDITLRVVNPKNLPEGQEELTNDPTYPQVELGITTFMGAFLVDWSRRLHPEDMEAMAALLLQEAQRARAARVS